ncbi:DoxX family protein [Actinacidiphila oryziradicis]|jgi:putative oxidoreductase|uniref:DoxX family protein n=1 Tax=Actinacidiphila oryziradicis TaxID=2571141 RepID=UPI0023F4A1A8|nr:DoxX family protein [Actinacidiphila oryziradicis]MCW2874880.1 RpiR family transcriptional regulator [Actinacidiphila oryziradicis]
MLLDHRKDLGLLAIRLGLGGALFAHGAQKLFGWFGGAGLDGTGAAMEQMGFTPGRESALASGLSEAGGGTLLALGLATPAAGAAVAGGMAAAVSVHVPAGFFAANGGFELPAFLGCSAAAIGLAGPGRYSLDHLTGHCLDRPGIMAVAFAASAAAATCVIRRRNAYLRAKAPASQQST